MFSFLWPVATVHHARHRQRRVGRALGFALLALLWCPAACSDDTTSAPSNVPSRPDRPTTVPGDSPDAAPPEHEDTRPMDADGEELPERDAEDETRGDTDAATDERDLVEDPENDEDVPCVPGEPGCGEPPTTGCCVDGEGCPDLCSRARLVTGRDCSGCDTPGEEGVCLPGLESPCNAETGALCQEVSCGGETWWCTELDGEWAWRITPICDDGIACTTEDQCQGGACVGTPYTCPTQSCPASTCDGTAFVSGGSTCTPACDGTGGCQPCVCQDGARQECVSGVNAGCCETACDPGFGCITRPGVCSGGDVCDDPRSLLLAGGCEGCGNAGAVGVCGGPRTEVCDESTADLCRQVSCGGQAFYCTNAGGTWAWRTAPACDDGDLCTHADTCQGGACVGVAVSCQDDACNVRTCDGTSTCASQPRTGETCDDGNLCTRDTTCSPTGTCTGGVPASTCGDGVCNCGETAESCPEDCLVVLPANACVNGNQNRDRCSNARTISRGAAAGTWNSGEQNTCTGSNRFSGECGGVFDVGNDHAYTVHVRAGEQVTMRLERLSRRCSNNDDYRARLKYRFNPNPAAAGATDCPGTSACHPVSPFSGEQTRTFQATEDGWLFVIVDGGASGFSEHRGYYNLRVTLAGCDSPGCGC